MGTAKVVVRRTAKKRSGTRKGTVTTVTRVKVSPQKVSTSKSRAVAKRTGDVGYVKGG